MDLRIVIGTWLIFVVPFWIAIPVFDLSILISAVGGFSLGLIGAMTGILFSKLR